MPESAWTVVALCTGRSSLLPGGKRSAIAKQPVLGGVRIGRLGLDGDTQVNRKYHGGPEMAVHLYPLDHDTWWRERIGEHPLIGDPGSFGGNLAVKGIDETQVRIGERFRLGTSVLEISQPRMPCATIERRFERAGMVDVILSSGRCGWYFRVVEEGEAMAGDSLVPVSGTGSPHSVRSTFLEIANPAHRNAAILHELADCDALSPEWRSKAVAALRRRAR